MAWAPDVKVFLPGPQTVNLWPAGGSFRLVAKSFRTRDSVCHWSPEQSHCVKASLLGLLASQRQGKPMAFHLYSELHCCDIRNCCENWNFTWWSWFLQMGFWLVCDIILDFRFSTWHNSSFSTPQMSVCIKVWNLNSRKRLAAWLNYASFYMWRQWD